MKIFAILTVLLLASTGPLLAAGPSVVLATTTSTQDTGLLDVLVPTFERASGYEVKTIAVGTGAALAMGEKGDADVLLVHAPGAEEAYMAKGRGLTRQLVMHNNFIVVGPPADPAKIKGTPSAATAFKAIAAAGAPFISRADNSGTNIKELDLWKTAGMVPDGDWYIKSGNNACIDFSGVASLCQVPGERTVLVSRRLHRDRSGADGRSNGVAYPERR
jgi:tungstate transport system substrate-binding protein